MAPGNFIASVDPTLTGVEPMISQNFLLASRLLTIKSIWPIETPASLGAANCACDVRAVSRAAIRSTKIDIRVFTESLLVLMNLSAGRRETGVDCRIGYYAVPLL